MSGPTQKHAFQAETAKLLELMIHSLYSNKEIFLRELVSNASDAIDKRRFEALTDEGIAQGFEKGEIRLEVDKDERTLTIHDNGIGMSRDEVIANIGTIARSGTQEMLRLLEQTKSKDAPTDLIGQFGVGFYSCFMAADKVTLISRRAGTEETTVWEYAGGGEFTVADGSREQAGTSITLHLKDADPEDGLDDFTDEMVIRRCVKKYSDFVRHPIILPIEKDEDGRPKVEEETLNSMKALWLRPESEVEDGERDEFYKHVARDWTEPFAHFSLKAEGRLEYQALLFIPSHAPFDLFSQGYEKGLKLYVRNVLIMDQCDELLPEYLRFLKGVVDSQDLPLNVSRELLQNNRQLAQIRSALTKKALDTLKGILDEDAQRYAEFWKEFGAVLKEGVSSDPKNKDRLLPLLAFQSTFHDEKLTTLKEYVERMKEDQEHIYVLTGESRHTLAASPHLEAFAAKGYEVLLLTDPIDEFMLAALPEFEGKSLKSVGKGEAELGSKDEKEEKAESEADFDALTKKLQEILDEHVKEVRTTERLTSSPACLVGAQGDLSPHIQRLMEQSKMQVPVTKRIMELNPDHPLVKGLKDIHDSNADHPELELYAKLLYGQALLAESSPLSNPAQFAGLLAKLMEKSI